MLNFFFLKESYQTIIEKLSEEKLSLDFENSKKQEETSSVKSILLRNHENQNIKKYNDLCIEDGVGKFCFLQKYKYKKSQLRIHRQEWDFKNLNLYVCNEKEKSPYHPPINLNKLSKLRYDQKQKKFVYYKLSDICDYIYIDIANIGNIQICEIKMIRNYVFYSSWNFIVTSEKQPMLNCVEFSVNSTHTITLDSKKLLKLSVKKIE